MTVQEPDPPEIELVVKAATRLAETALGRERRDLVNACDALGRALLRLKQAAQRGDYDRE